MNPNWNKYTTEREKKYIDELGTHRQDEDKKRVSATPEERLRLLRGYRDSIPLRADWGYIDPQEIAAYIEASIVRELNKLNLRHRRSVTDSVSISVH